MSKKKLLILIGSILAVCILITVIVIFVIDRNDGGSSAGNADQTGNGDQGDRNDGDSDTADDDKYDEIQGNAVLLTENQSVKIKAPGFEVRFISENEAVAKVNASGVVTAVSAGETKITCNVDGVETVYNVYVSKTVKDADLVSPDTEKAALVCAENNVGAGGYTVLPVYMVNNKKVAGFSVTVSYDVSKLTLKTVDATQSGDSVQFVDNGSGKVKVVGISNSADRMGTADGKLFELFFMAKQDASGECPITLLIEEDDMILDAKEVVIDTEVYSGSVQIVK